MKVCAQCGHGTYGLNYCDHCGANLRPTVRPKLIQAAVYGCGNCGQVLYEDDTYCSRCGTYAGIATKCSRGHDVGAPDANFCQSCGESLQIGRDSMRYKVLRPIGPPERVTSEHEKRPGFVQRVRNELGRAKPIVKIIRSTGQIAQPPQPQQQPYVPWGQLGGQQPMRPHAPWPGQQGWCGPGGCPPNQPMPQRPSMPWNGQIGQPACGPGGCPSLPQQPYAPWGPMNQPRQGYLPWQGTNAIGVILPHGYGRQ